MYMYVYVHCNVLTLWIHVNAFSLQTCTTQWECRLLGCPLRWWGVACPLLVCFPREWCHHQEWEVRYILKSFAFISVHVDLILGGGGWLDSTVLLAYSDPSIHVHVSWRYFADSVVILVSVHVWLLHNSRLQSRCHSVLIMIFLCRSM